MSSQNSRITPRPLRIIHVLHSHGYGGAENHALILMNTLQSLGHEVLYAGPSDSWLADACTTKGIATKHLRMTGIFDLPSYWRLYRLARDWRADIVHGHAVRGAQYAGWTTLHSNGPIAICTAHSTNAYKHMGRCKHIIAVSQAVKSNLTRHGHPLTKITVVHNGVPDIAHEPHNPAAIRKNLGLTASDLAIFNAGRFVPDKGQDILIEAIKLCQQPVRLFLAGDASTPFGQKLQQRTAGNRQIHFLGYRGDIQQLLPAFDIYASPSRREAIGLSIIEASAAKLPIVATEVGGVPEVVLNGITGTLIPTENPGKMAQAIDHLAANPALRSAMGEQARAQYTKHFTETQMALNTLAVYQSAIASR